MLLFGAAAATGAAAVGAATAVLLAECSADRTGRAYAAMSKMFFTMPLDAPDGSRPALVLVRGSGEHGPG